MASTAEELASQAEQLQSTMAFFKVGDEDAAIKKSAPRPTVQKLPHSTRRPHGSTAAGVPAMAVGKKSGVVLSMGGNGDHEDDDDFEKF
ncbi:MAG: hypothetical protein M0Z67_18060 [Nitrospiraceae bacterium]|nr:hypothetical protein [Nitrospiraceae bacterium]